MRGLSLKCQSTKYLIWFLTESLSKHPILQGAEFHPILRAGKLYMNCEYPSQTEYYIASQSKYLSIVCWQSLFRDKAGFTKLLDINCLSIVLFLHKNCSRKAWFTLKWYEKTTNIDHLHEVVNKPPTLFRDLVNNTECVPIGLWSILVHCIGNKMAFRMQTSCITMGNPENWQPRDSWLNSNKNVICLSFVYLSNTIL